MALTRVSYTNASPKGSGDNRLDSIPAKAKHLNEVIDRLEDGNYQAKRNVNNSLLNTGAAVTTTLTAAQSGTHFNIDGTDDIVINMPALSTGNVGVTYSFLVTTAVASGKSVKLVLPGSGVSNWYAKISHYENNPYPKGDNAGDELTFPASSDLGSKCVVTCVADDGTNSTWMADIDGGASATVPTNA